VSTYRYIAQRQEQVPVRQLCHVLRVSASAYYAWQRRQLPAPAPAWQVAVRTECRWHAARYGTRRLRAELHAKGYPVGRWRIWRALAAAGLRAQQPRSFVPRTTNSDPNERAAPNLLLGRPAPTAPNQVWVGDITYLPKQGGGWLDRYSRKVVGWDVRESMPEALVSEALHRALAVRQPAAGLVIHPDQGSQYSATTFEALVARHEAVQRMSRRGNCYDNAHAESFWSRFKTELLAGGSFRKLSSARLEISHYLAYYKAERRHSALGYLPPNHFETHFQTTSHLCAA
jgi:transposase InsO family protein